MDIKLEELIQLRETIKAELDYNTSHCMNTWEQETIITLIDDALTGPTDDAVSRVKGLKPCPFCGGLAASGEKVNDSDGCIMDGLFVFCTICGAETDLYCTEADAVKSWNKRAGENVQRRNNNETDFV